MAKGFGGCLVCQVGNWENDRRHGYGVLFDVDCEILEQGDWCADNVGTCASK